MKERKIELFYDRKQNAWSWFIFEYRDEYWCNIGWGAGCKSYENAAKSAYKHFMEGVMDLTTISKYISFILRHNPRAAGINLTEHGYANCDELVNAIQKKYPKFDIATLKEIVDTDEKQRYSFNDNKTMIRANYGHSIAIEMEYDILSPPEFLYHGTSQKALKSIMEKGILPMKRQYVHLTESIDIASDVGKRHGDPIVLKINCSKMAHDGFKFYRSENGVWLSNMIPKEYIEKEMYIKKEE